MLPIRLDHELQTFGGLIQLEALDKAFIDCILKKNTIFLHSVFHGVLAQDKHPCFNILILVSSLVL